MLQGEKQNFMKLYASILLFVFSFFIKSPLFAFEELLDFGTNPGNLKAFVHYPKNFTKELKYPLVVALHGCSQTAENIAIQSGWDELADKNDFIVLYPEQRLVNNASKCFNWFLEKDVAGNEGELASIIQMINTLKNQNVVIDSNIFAYGLSAGAAMSVVLLANQPSTFQSGAIFAGGPFGMAGSLGDIWKGMRNPEPQTQAYWLQKLPFPTSEIKPKLIVCHGTKDPIVSPSSSQELIKQWTAWHQVSYTPTERTIMENHPQVQVESYGANSEIKYYEFAGLGHVLPVDPGTGAQQGGSTGMFSKDEDFFSTYFIALDFGLIK